MRNRRFVCSMVLAFLLPVTLGLACVERDWSICSPQDQCRPGFTCTDDFRCVRASDGGSDGLLSVDSRGLTDAAGGGVDGAMSGGTDGAGSPTTAPDAAGLAETALHDTAAATPGIDASAGTVGASSAPDAPADVPTTPADAPPLLSPGAPCSADSDCAGGDCADSVCCDKPCTGCNACKQTLSGKPDGTCAPVVSGQDPHNTCTDETATKPCGNDGTCDGAGACRKVSNSHICTPASCSGTTFTPAATCDGAGACPAAKTQDCGAFQCALTGCLKTCASQTDCDSTTSYCDTTAKTCAAKLSNGSAASQGYQCSSGIVADGVCCDGACAGQCQGCAELNKVGTCSTVSGAPRGTRAACTATVATCAGHCGGLPDKCVYPAGEAVCSGASCSSDLAMQTASVCNGAGACTASSVVPCGSGKYCSGPACVAQIANGGSCLNGNQCMSGNCSNNLCCATGLTGCGTICISILSSNTNCGSCGRICAAGSTCSGGSCYLVDGQSCTAGAQCLSGVCSTFYVDSDADGYGTSVSVQQCGTTVPTGYANKSGDCCDSDPKANPGQTGWFDKADLCGTFDYNCDMHEIPKSNTPLQGTCGTPICANVSGTCTYMGGCTCGAILDDPCAGYTTAPCGQSYVFATQYCSGTGGSCGIGNFGSSPVGTQACN